MKVSFACVLMILSILFSCTYIPEERKQPNIILIMADDLGYGDIGCFGNDSVRTPVLDKLAAEGIRFTDFHSNGAVCSPTRAALMTGNYQQRAGIEGVIYAALDKRIYGISDKQKTMAEYYKEAGYTTGIFGKWHLGYKPEFNPVFHGFDEFYGYVSGNVDYISHRDGVGLLDWWHNTDTCYDEGYVTDIITDKALEFMVKNRNNPFFLYLPHEAVHYPYQGRNEKADRLPGVNFTAHGSRSDKKQAYREMLEIMDENIGRIMNKLEELDLNNSTFVLFCSDNGATNMGNNGNLNGFKGSLWEGGHRVPAIAWFPSRIKAGVTINSAILSMDILPTLLKVSGISGSDNFDGKDFSKGLFTGERMIERPVFWRYRNQWAVRMEDWKYLKIGENEFLFNLKNDLAEQNNLINQNPLKAADLNKMLDDWEMEMSKYELQTD